jgi:putative ABC transport system ATP-binding protein
MPIVSLRGVRRVYRSGSLAVEALRGIDLEVEPREFIAIMGPSGSGKSTLMNILGCLDSPSAGSYLLDGEDVAALPRSRLAAIRNETLGFVFQFFHLLPRTSALENVELPLLYRSDELSWKEIHARSREALRRVGLEDREGHTPSELSGGQKQRVAIARALVTQPTVLLADEPTGNLDERATRGIVQLLREINALGTAVIMATHDLSLIMRSGYRYLELERGTLLYDGTDARRLTRHQ